MRIINPEKVLFLAIGRAGEVSPRTLTFDISRLGEGEVLLYCRRPGETAVYSVEVSARVDEQGRHLIDWTPSAFDLQFAGQGYAEIRVMEDTRLIKSTLITTEIIPALEIPGGVRSIESVEQIGAEGLMDRYRMTFSDGTYFDYIVTNGTQGAPGVTPQVELIPDEGGYLLRVTTGGTVSEYRLDPAFLDAATLTQTLGSRTDRAPSEHAVQTALAAHRGGWTDEQIDLFEDSVDSLATALGTPEEPGAAFATEEAATAAVTAIASFRALIESLRETPTPPAPEVVVTVSGGKISTNANTLTVSDGKIKLEV